MFKTDPSFLNRLASLIEGDGSFFVSQGKYTSCEITLHENEFKTAEFIKKVFGGSVHKKSDVKAVR